MSAPENRAQAAKSGKKALFRGAKGRGNCRNQLKFAPSETPSGGFNEGTRLGTGEIGVQFQLILKSGLFAFWCA